MASQIPKLYMVTLIKSGIGKPYWEKRTLDALGLTKIQKSIIHKNTPSINGMLRAVKHLVRVQPIVLRTDVENSPCGDKFVNSQGEFFIENPSQICEGVNGVNPRRRLRRKSAGLFRKRRNEK